MAQQKVQITPEALKTYKPLDRLSDEQRVLLASKAARKLFRKGTSVMELGSDDGNTYFLIDGQLKVEAKDGRAGILTPEAPAARSAIAHLRPRQYAIRAKTDAWLLVVPDDVLHQLLKQAPVESENQMEQRDSRDPIYQLLMDIQSDLKSNRFKLPSLPDIAFRIKKLIDRDTTTAEDIARLVAADPAITVKLIKACNSPLYRRSKEVTSCREAVVRLGMETTRQLVTIFSMRELFKSKRKELQEAMDNLWQHSREVAAIAYVLADIAPSLDKDRALLAGLIHDVGAISVISYAEGYVDIWADPKNLREAIDELKAEIGSLILGQWGFSQDLIDVVVEAENWNYDSGKDEATYADLIIVSQVHQMIGKPEQKTLPPFNRIPAFGKLSAAGLSPQKSLKVLVEARSKINEILDLLSGG